MLRSLLCGLLFCVMLAACAPKDDTAASNALAEPAEITAPADVEVEPAKEKVMQLSGEVWLVDEISGKPVTIPADARQPFIEFDGENASGYAGCNTFRGSYTIDGATLKFGPMISTKKACGGPLDEIEMAMHQALGKVAEFSIADATLTLIDEDATVLIRASTRNP